MATSNFTNIDACTPNATQAIFTCSAEKNTSPSHSVRLVRTDYLAARRMASSRRPVVVSGPSGGGKSTILNRAMQEYPDAFAFSVSRKCMLSVTREYNNNLWVIVDTTRSPRPGERDGVHYHYVTREKMQEMIDGGEFLEHAEFGGNMYGTRSVLSTIALTTEPQL